MAGTAFFMGYHMLRNNVKFDFFFLKKCADHIMSDLGPSYSAADGKTENICELVTT